MINEFNFTEMFACKSFVSPIPELYQNFWIRYRIKSCIKQWQFQRRSLGKKGRVGPKYCLFDPSSHYCLSIFTPRAVLAFRLVVLDVEFNFASNTTDQKANSECQSDLHRKRQQLDPEQQQHEATTSLTNIERNKRNRARTLKQRQRHYRHEIIRRGIDSRFSIKIVKEILRRYEIPYTAVNISKSTMTGRTSLYIGIRNPSKLREYEARTKNLFTTDYYNEFRARHRL